MTDIMKRHFLYFIAAALMCSLAACGEKNPVPQGPEEPEREIPQWAEGRPDPVDEYPIDYGIGYAEGNDVGVTIEVLEVMDRNFVFELRPGAMVQSFKLDVYPMAQLYNNLLNDRNSGALEGNDAVDISERIRDYLFNESGSGGYAFSVEDFESAEDFLQIEYDWMNTSYAAASAIAIPDCDYVIAVVASTSPEISSSNQEQLTLCYVRTSKQPLIGDPQVEIAVNVGYTAFNVSHILNADAAAVYFFGYLQSEIDEYIDTFGERMFRDFVRTRVTAPSYPDDPNNPEALTYSVNYGDAADASVMSTTVAVAVDANLTPQEDYARTDFHLNDVPDDVSEPEVSVNILEERVAASYVEFDVNFTADCKTVFYNVVPAWFLETVEAMSAKEKRDLARYLRDYGYGCHNPEFAWDADKEEATGSGATVRLDAVSALVAMEVENSPIMPGETYAVIYVGRNGAMQLSDLMVSETFTTDERNMTSPDGFTDGTLKLVTDNPGRTQFRGTVTYDPSKVSMIYIQYMTADNNPGLDEDSSWNDWMEFIFGSGTSNMLVNAWPTLSSGRDGLTWTGMTPDTDYTLFMCAEDFDGNISQMYFSTIRTSEVQVGPDPTIVMSLEPADNYPYDWTVSYRIDHDVEYYLYCYTDSASDLSPFIPGLTSASLKNIKESGIGYEAWRDGIYEWVAGGFENNGGGMRTESDTSQDWEGDQVVIAACIAVGKDEDGQPVYKMYHLICEDGKAQTLEEIFGITE